MIWNQYQQVIRLSGIKFDQLNKFSSLNFVGEKIWLGGKNLTKSDKPNFQIKISHPRSQCVLHYNKMIKKYKIIIKNIHKKN